MPVVEQIPTHKGRILNWRIVESLAELEKKCADEGINATFEVQHEMRKKQQCVTQLLHAQLHPGMQLKYTAAGKPIISDTVHVSISHSGDYVTMMTSSIACGVDIEKTSQKVSRVRHKFLNEQELQRTSNSNEIELTRYWTAKEAMFKVYGSDKVFLRNNIFVEPTSQEIWRAVLQDGTLELVRLIRFKQFDNMVLAWTEATDEA